MFGEKTTLKEAFLYGALSGVWFISGAVWFMDEFSWTFDSDLVYSVKILFVAVTIGMIFGTFRAVYKDLSRKEGVVVPPA